MSKTLIVVLVFGLTVAFALQYQPLSKSEALDTKLDNQPTPVFSLVKHPSAISTRSAIFAENFTDVTFPPTGWSILQTNTGTTGDYPCYWSRFTTPDYAVRTEPASAGLWWSYSNQNEWLISPDISLTGSPSGNYYLRYWTYGYFGSPDSDHYYTKISTDNGNTWNELYDLSEQCRGWNRYEEPVNIDLTFYAGQTVKIAWQVEDGPSNHGISYVWFIDDIVVGYPYPIDVGASNLLAINTIPLVVGDPDTFRIRVSNFGTTDETDFPVSMSADGNVIDVLSISVAAMSFFDTIFTWTPSDIGDYELKFFTQLTGDEDLLNDTVTKNMTVCPEFHTTPYSKDFNEDWGTFGDNPPFCGWQIVDNGDEVNKRWNRNDWFKGSLANPSREVAAVRYSPREHQDEWLISPRLDCSVANQYTLSYWHQYEGYKDASPDTGYVLVSTDGGNNWTEITKYAGGVSGLVSYGYQTHDITPLVSGQSDVRVAFRYYAYNAGRWHIDDFAVIYTPNIDAMPTAIECPDMILLNDTFDVTVTVKNAGLQQLLANWYVYLQMRGERDSALVDVALNSGETWSYTFEKVVAEMDTYTLTARTNYAGDEYPLNDVLWKRINATGWAPRSNVPSQVEGKGVKDGGALVTCFDTIYAFRGGNSNEFYAYDPTTDVWALRCSIGYALKKDSVTPLKKKVKAGGALTVYQDDIYAFKGGCINEFWRYTPGQDTWVKLTDIPKFWYSALKPTKVKSGGALTAYADSIYAFKGGNTREFWMYIPETDQWVPRCSLLTSDSKRIKGGAALVTYNDLIYAFVGGGTNHFYAYLPGLDLWIEKAVPSFDNPLKPHKAKVKDGAALAVLDGKIYAFRGGNTKLFGYYEPTEDTWYRLENIVGIKKVKAGGTLTAYSGKIYAFKGGNTKEFWGYTPLAETVILPLKSISLTNNSTLTEKNLTATNFTLNVTPNPFTKHAAIQYTVPISGKVTLKLYNATGRLIETLNDSYLSSGNYTKTLTTTEISKGVYFLRYNDKTNNAEVKLIVQ
jgi:hypothetical protein